MKSHLNVSAKLELQTQERMYESRLLHLENGEKVVCIFYTEILIMHNQNHDIEITKDNTDLYLPSMSFQFWQKCDNRKCALHI